MWHSRQSYILVDSFNSDNEFHHKSRDVISSAATSSIKSLTANDVIYEIRNSHIPGGVYINGLVTWRDCVYACVEPCAAADFDTNDRSCWHHYGLSACSIPTLYQSRVNHYRTLSCLTVAPVVSGDLGEAISSFDVLWDWEIIVHLHSCLYIKAKWLTMYL